MSDKTIKAVVLKDFNDAGTEKSFIKDAEVEIGEGDFGNYEAAGLVRKAGSAKADTKPA